MRLQNLADVHARRHAERIEHDIHRLTVGQERHVFLRHDLGDHALVAVTAGHLVARLRLAFHRDEDLDHLHHSRRQFVAALELLDLVEEALLEPLLRLIILLAHGLDLTHQLFVADGELPPLLTRVLVEQFAADLCVPLEVLRTRGRFLAVQHPGETAEHVAIQDRLLVVAVFREAFDFLALDRERTLVLVDAVAVEDADFDDRALHARRHFQRGVADVGGLFAEDRAKQLFFRRHRTFALRRDLADQDVAARTSAPI